MCREPAIGRRLVLVLTEARKQTTSHATQDVQLFTTGKGQAKVEYTSPPQLTNLFTGFEFRKQPTNNYSHDRGNAQASIRTRKISSAPF
ncbi:hypothetical protein L210DRAFT_951268 [Boletus edulis BED1]|uniref:Uncharacterized protein n=1 Tax=Boletus edulis BED1 TaxID=1328754 RepID=A0AAD4BGP5_BOLED|nr:hypothetical protein L210DRAFT_951268 [Boletus edulis BED1]